MGHKAPLRPWLLLVLLLLARVTSAVQIETPSHSFNAQQHLSNDRQLAQGEEEEDGSGQGDDEYGTQAKKDQKPVESEAATAAPTLKPIPESEANAWWEPTPDIDVSKLGRVFAPGTAPAAATTPETSGETSAEATTEETKQAETMPTVATPANVDVSELGRVFAPTDTTGKQAEPGSNHSSTEKASDPAAAPDLPKTRKAPQKVQILVLAPEVQVANDGDIDPEGPCQQHITKFCKYVSLGEGRVASCLSNVIAEQESDSSLGKRISDDCRASVYAYKVEISKNINLNIALAKACKEDALRLCNGTSNPFKLKWKAGSVISCLKDAKSELSPDCKAEVFKIQYDAAMDFRADPALFAACEGDSKRLCPKVEYGGGRVQECLRNQPVGNISWDCREKLFWQEVENSDDIRLSVRLFSKCLDDKRKFCPEIAPGNAVVKDCLEHHRNEDGFTEQCKTELEKMIERRVRDFRLDSRLRQMCMEDMAQLCSIAEYVDDDEHAFQGRESLVNCLQDYISEIQNQECARMVQKYQRYGSEDIRFSSDLASACFEDRNAYCSNVPAGSARVIRCLKRNRARLSMVCRAQLFDEEIKFSSNIDFQYPMKSTCQREIKVFCAGIPHGNARVIRCLQDKKDRKGFGEECRSEVKRYEQDSSQDYRFNHRLAKACKADVETLCKGLCTPDKGDVCGGRVLRCLIDKKEEISNEACVQEVQYFEKMQVADFRNDVILAQTCRADVERFCSEANPDKELGAMHKCLRDHYNDVSEECRAEEMKVEMMENENIELSPNLLKACSMERDMFCKEVAPGSGRVFKCLADHMGDSDFGKGCMTGIRNKLQRRQANWRLDPSLRKQCKASVDQLCADVDKTRQPGAVVKCLVDNRKDVHPGCLKELGRAVHMAFFIWQKDGVITSVCDGDVTKMCLKKRPNMDRTPGAVASCLADALERESLLSMRRLKAKSGDDASLSKDCSALADIAIPQNVKKQFYDSLSFALVASQLDKFERGSGVSMLSRNQNGEAQAVKLTGWTALAGVCALLVVLVYGATILYRRYKGIPGGADYTVVLKGKAAARSGWQG